MEHPYFAVARKLLESDMWLSDPFTKGQAWVDLIGNARFRDGFVRIRGVKVDVPRGCVYFSEVKLAERWRWSRGKVRRFLNELETEQRIEQQKNNITSLIKIINYEEYQKDGTAKRTANSTASGTANGTATTNKDNGDKGDNVFICPEPSASEQDIFIYFPTNKNDEFYPVRKSQVSEYQKLYPAVNVEQEVRGMKAWQISNMKNRKTFSGMPRFMNSWLERAQNKAAKLKTQPRTPAYL